MIVRTYVANSTSTRPVRGVGDRFVSELLVLTPKGRVKYHYAMCYAKHVLSVPAEEYRHNAALGFDWFFTVLRLFGLDRDTELVDYRQMGICRDDGNWWDTPGVKEGLNEFIERAALKDQAR